MSKPMVGKLINIDLWLARDADKDRGYSLFEHPPSQDGEWWTFTRGERLFFDELNYSKRRVFSGLKPGEICRVRLQRME